MVIIHWQFALRYFELMLLHNVFVVDVHLLRGNQLTYYAPVKSILPHKVDYPPWCCKTATHPAYPCPKLISQNDELFWSGTVVLLLTLLFCKYHNTPSHLHRATLNHTLAMPPPNCIAQSGMCNEAQFVCIYFFP